MEYQYDLIVIGAGPGGYPAALKAAALGRRVAVVERDKLGGTCLNRGCIPTKTLLHVSGLYRETAKAGRFGIRAEHLNVDLTQMWQHKDQVVSDLESGIGTLFQKQKITYFHGTGTVLKPHCVAVTGEDGGQQLTGEYILLAAGSKPSPLPIPGMDLPGVCDSDRILGGNRLGAEESSLYERVVIIGGGVIGMEMATVYNNLGSRVTVLEAAGRILPTMEKEIAQNLKMILKKKGVEIHAPALVKEILSGPDGLTCVYEEKGEAGSVTADGVLVSVGRRPVTEGLFSEELGRQMKFDRGYLEVNAGYETAVPGIYGVGDLIGGIQLAHMATAEGIRAVESMFSLPCSQNLELIPSCVYTEPEIACVGLTADEAKEKGVAVKTAKYVMSANGKSVLTLQERGFIKLVAEEATGRLLGAQLMCGRATDMIGFLTLAIGKQMTAADAASAVMAHPTFGEAIGEAAELLL